MYWGDRHSVDHPALRNSRLNSAVSFNFSVWLHKQMTTLVSKFGRHESSMDDDSKETVIFRLLYHKGSNDQLNFWHVRFDRNLK